MNGPMHEYADRLVAAPTPVEQVLEREFEARLVESSRHAFRIAFSVLRQRQDAEDVAQETFLKAHRSFHQLRDRHAFRAWLVRMAWRLALDRQRANRRRTNWEFQQAQTASIPSTQETVFSRERAAQLWDAIDALPEKLRIVVVLANIEGHNLQEVADLVGVAEGTVKSRLFLARQQLREKLQWTLDVPAH
jgi:RNA polymerase sigma-70 factor (ECF subfamily)